MARSPSTRSRVSEPSEDSKRGGCPSQSPSGLPFPDPHFLKILRPLVEAYQAFLQVSDRNIASMGLTRGQFDVIVTLGRTEGLRCTDIAQETLVTKGTLTGVLTRLEKKKLVTRTQNPQDKRGQIIRLTPAGDALYEKVFPRHIRHLEGYFERSLAPEEMDMIRPLLLRMRDTFRAGAGDQERPPAPS
ncbi:MAG: MarR family winged helix-turn-helix transcriptional regulator [Leptospirillia bacterium]